VRVLASGFAVFVDIHGGRQPELAAAPVIFIGNRLRLITGTAVVAA
jgi:hypothetical protein